MESSRVPPIFWPARSTSATERERRVAEHQEALLHQHVGLRELDGAKPRRLVGDEADVGLSALDRLDHRRRIGGGLDIERFADPLASSRARSAEAPRSSPSGPLLVCAGLVPR